MRRGRLKSRHKTVFGDSYYDSAEDDNDHQTVIEDTDVADFLQQKKLPGSVLIGRCF